MNFDLKIALVKAGRPAYRVAAEAGLSTTQLHRLLYGIRAARPAERASLARVLGVAEAQIFPDVAAVAA